MTHGLHFQSQSDTPIITRRKIRKAKMNPETAYTMAEVKDMETVLKDILTKPPSTLVILHSHGETVRTEPASGSCQTGELSDAVLCWESASG